MGLSSPKDTTTDYNITSKFLRRFEMDSFVSILSFFWSYNCTKFRFLNWTIYLVWRMQLHILSPQLIVMIEQIYWVRLTFAGLSDFYHFIPCGLKNQRCQDNETWKAPISVKRQPKNWDWKSINNKKAYYFANERMLNFNKVYWPVLLGAKFLHCFGFLNAMTDQKICVCLSFLSLGTHSNFRILSDPWYIVVSTDVRQKFSAPASSANEVYPFGIGNTFILIALKQYKNQSLRYGRSNKYAAL